MKRYIVWNICQSCFLATYAAKTFRNIPNVLGGIWELSLVGFKIFIPRILSKYSESFKKSLRHTSLERRLNMFFKPNIFSIRRIGLLTQPQAKITLKMAADNGNGAIGITIPDIVLQNLTFSLLFGVVRLHNKQFGLWNIQ